MAFPTENNLRTLTSRAGSIKHLKDTQPGRRARFDRAKSESTLRCGADFLKKQRSSSSGLLLYCSSRTSSSRLYCHRPQLPNQESMLPSNLLVQTSRTRNATNLYKGSRSFRRASMSAIPEHSSVSGEYKTTKAPRRHSGEPDTDCRRPQSDKVVPTCPQSSVTRPLDLTAAEYANKSACSGGSFHNRVGHQPTRRPPPKLTGSGCSPKEAVKAAIKLSEALETMGLFDEEEEKDSDFFDDPLRLDSSAGHQSAHF